MPTLDEILRQYPPDVRPTRIEPLGSAGGLSGAQFWRITAARGTLIFRRWPIEHPAPDQLRFIHAVLDHAARNGIAFIPRPLRTTAGESFVNYAGHLWELTPWLPGAADYERAPSRKKLHAALEALARFHVATANFPRQAAPGFAGGSNAVTRHLARLHELSSGGLIDLSRSITDTTWPDLAPLARQFVAELPRVVPRAIAQLEPLANAPLPLQPCIRDIWHDHVLFTGDTVTGIIDFGSVDIDTPATDIARLLGSLASCTPLPFREGLWEGSSPRINTWDEGLAAYSAIRPLSADESRAARALDTSGTILAGCNWIRWIYIDGRQFENREQVINRFRKIVRRCTEPPSGGIT